MFAPHQPVMHCASLDMGQSRLSHINSAQAILAFNAHSLADNALNEKGAKVIAEAIVKMPQLTSLK